MVRGNAMYIPDTFAPTRALLLERQNAVQIWIIGLNARVAKVQTQTDLIRQMRVTPPIQGVVMHAALNMRCLVDNQAVRVYSQLGLNGVPFLLATVMRLALLLILWPGNLLFCRVQESFEFWKHRFDFFERLQSPCPVMQLLRYGQNFFDKRLKFSYVFEHIALVKVEKNPCERGCNVKPVVEKKHEKPLPQRQLVRMASTHLTFPIVSGKPLCLI